jgi:hypothetical protein
MTREELITTLKTPRAKKIGIAILAVAAVVFSAAWNPPVGTVHKFTTASDYNAKKESGCTNSGEGCHGSETLYRDFNAYHPNATCTTCHDYQGVGCIPCHSPNKNHECAACHDGTMKNAADVTKLGDPYPRGHYRETTHTATGTDMTAAMVAAEGGKASATCGDCHARDLRDAHNGVPEVEGSPYGPVLGCGDCHNDVRSFGMAEVLSDWKDRTCEACHKIGGSSVMHDPRVATAVESGGIQACGDSGAGCHESNDLHALHPDEPATCSGAAAVGELGCHDMELQSHEPTATTCGSDAECHIDYHDEVGHKNMVSHAPSSSVPARNTSYFGTACGACHFMDPDGSSLMVEHDLPTSQRTFDSGDGCRNCHNSEPSQVAIADKWPDRDTPGSCDTCHGVGDLQAMHGTDLTSTHYVPAGSEGCAASGPGCHPDTDLSKVGEPTVSGNLHATCLRCHDRTASGGNLAYDPDKRTCGAGRDCHGATGGYDTQSGIHDGAGGLANGSDVEHHSAGASQAGALLLAQAGYPTDDCGGCHNMTLGIEHARPTSGLATGPGTICIRCHNADLSIAGVVKANWPQSGTATACESCHTEPMHAAPGPAHIASERDSNGLRVVAANATCHDTTDVRALHEDQGCQLAGCHQATGPALSSAKMSCGGTDENVACHVGYNGTNHGMVDPAHKGIELDPTGAAVPGSCATPGCHTDVNIRVLHPSQGCTMAGCHEADGTLSGLPIMSCGGLDADAACHIGFSVANHFVSHAADGSFADNGCTGCHQAELVIEHSNSLSAGVMEAQLDGAAVCVLCHDPENAGNSPYAMFPAVESAVTGGVTKCGGCHKSGSATDGPTAIASPHSTISTEETLPAGAVWANPLDGWRAAYGAQAGGGHNPHSPAALGLGSSYAFPTWQYVSGETTYTWSITPNSGSTRWLSLDRYPAESVDTTVEIAAMTVRCDDCHSMPESMVGPHGAAVRVYIDAGYSQTAYANPPTMQSQFQATGIDRVVCMKCHPMQAAYPPSVVDTITPGGHYVHAAHVRHTSRYTPSDATYYGEACIDCHVRIPHAWVRPRLLVRTAETAVGGAPDAFPYVSKNHDGLAGIRLRSFEGTTALRAASCATEGCIDNHNSTWHPQQSDIPGAEYWP